MNMIISIRGTNGSGKSTIIRTLLKEHKHKPIYGVLGPRMPEAYEVKVPRSKAPVYVLGPYVTSSGGCDSVQPYELIIELIEKYGAKGHVVFEGVIVTSVYGRVGILLEKWGMSAVFMFLDTTLETCLERIEARRGRPRDARLIKNVTAKYNTAMRIKQKVTEEKKMQVATVSSDTGLDFLLKLLPRAQKV